GARVHLRDYVLGTGGSVAAGRALLEGVGSAVFGFPTLLAIAGRGGREALGGDVHVLFHVLRGSPSLLRRRVLRRQSPGVECPRHAV
ncbi:hypothetical protein NS183_09565, partial [Microbacterium testaceum]